MDKSTLNYYENHACELSSRYEKANVKELHEKLLETFSSCTRLLEIGCGTGREAAYMLSRGFDISCVEPAFPMIKEALRCHPELNGRLFKGSVPGDIPVTLDIPESVEGVYAVASLMHMREEELAPAFALFKRLLKPGGRLLFSVPLTRTDLAQSGYDKNGRYFLLLDKAEWSRRLLAAGYNSIHASTNSDGMGRGSVTWLTCTALLSE